VLQIYLEIARAVSVHKELGENEVQPLDPLDHVLGVVRYERVKVGKSRNSDSEDAS
jgi:hypothetical protein